MDGPARPPRMCSACTQCHAAKVRCTGERSGCARCRQIGAECVYKVSLVGRTSKHGSSRNRRASSTSGSNSGSGRSGGSAAAAARHMSASSTSSPITQPEAARRPPSSSQARVETIHVAAAYGAEEPQPQHQHQHHHQHQHQHQHLSPSSFLDHEVHDLMMDEGVLENMSQEFMFDWEVDPAPAAPSAIGRRNYGTDNTESSDSATVFGGSSAEEGLFPGPTSSALLASVPAINAAVASATAAAAAAMSKPVGEGMLARRLAQPQQTRQHHSLPFGEPSPKLTVAAAAAITAADPHNLTRLVSLAEIVRVLEASVNSKKQHTPDAIMKTNKACMAELAGLFGCVKPLGNCQSCCLLITSALDLILTLFEDISESLSALANGKSGHGSDRVSANGGTVAGAAARPMPPVQFGVFELDPEEQLAMTKRILHSELRRYQHIANGFSASVTAAVPGHIQSVLDDWWEGMKKRLCRLLSVMAV